MQSCVFCKIISRVEDADIIGETESAIIFSPLSPAVFGHILVAPKAHIPDLWSLNLEAANQIMAATLRASHALKNALSPDGLNLINSAGEAASQTIFHVHFHLVPRWHGDQFGEIWPPRSGRRAEAETIAAVRESFSGLGS